MRHLLILFGLPFFLLDAWLNKDGIFTFILKGIEEDFSGLFIEHDNYFNHHK